MRSIKRNRLNKSNRLNKLNKKKIRKCNKKTRRQTKKNKKIRKSMKRSRRKMIGGSGDSDSIHLAKINTDILNDITITSDNTTVENELKELGSNPYDGRHAIFLWHLRTKIKDTLLDTSELAPRYEDAFNDAIQPFLSFFLDTNTWPPIVGTTKFKSKETITDGILKYLNYVKQFAISPPGR